MAKNKLSSKRRWKCFGLKEIQGIEWAAQFEIGKIYHEVDYSKLEEDLSTNSVICLLVDDKFPFYVDESQFKLLVK